MLLRPSQRYRRCLVILVVIPLTWSFLLLGGTRNNNSDNHNSQKAAIMSLSASATSTSGDDNPSDKEANVGDAAHSEQDCKETSAEDNTVPLLEAPDPDESSKLPSFKLGETIRLEEMGPIIINTEGKFCCFQVVSQLYLEYECLESYFQGPSLTFDLSDFVLT